MTPVSVSCAGSVPPLYVDTESTISTFTQETTALEVSAKAKANERDATLAWLHTLATFAVWCANPGCGTLIVIPAAEVDDVRISSPFLSLFFKKLLTFSLSFADNLPHPTHRSHAR
jgi:hypothetical protein